MDFGETPGDIGPIKKVSQKKSLTRTNHKISKGSFPQSLFSAAIFHIKSRIHFVFQKCGIRLHDLIYAITKCDFEISLPNVNQKKRHSNISGVRNYNNILCERFRIIFPNKEPIPSSFRVHLVGDGYPQT